MEHICHTDGWLYMFQCVSVRNKIKNRSPCNRYLVQNSSVTTFPLTHFVRSLTNINVTIHAVKKHDKMQLSDMCQKFFFYSRYCSVHSHPCPATQWDFGHIASVDNRLRLWAMSPWLIKKTFLFLALAYLLTWQQMYRILNYIPRPVKFRWNCYRACYRVGRMSI